MHPLQSLGNVDLDWTPHPGNYLDLQGKTYAVLERVGKGSLLPTKFRIQRRSLQVFYNSNLKTLQFLPHC